MKNSKNVQNSIKKAFKELRSMSDEMFQKEIEHCTEGYGNLLRDGCFFGHDSQAFEKDYNETFSSWEACSLSDLSIDVQSSLDISFSSCIDFISVSFSNYFESLSDIKLSSSPRLEEVTRTNSIVSVVTISEDQDQTSVYELDLSTLQMAEDRCQAA